MSSDADAAAAIVAVFDSIYTSDYCNVAAAVLFIYDALITFDREVACFCTSKRTGAPLLFFANKVISLTAYIMSLVEYAPFPSDKRFVYSLEELRLRRMTVDVCSCSLFVIALQAMGILQFVPVAAFSALRAYVLSRSKPLGVLIFILSLAPVGANLVRYSYQFSGAEIPPLGCIRGDNVSAALNLRFVTIISRVPLIAVDVSLIYITWKKLSSWSALGDIRRSKRLTLSGVLIGGGIIYFIVLFTLNVLHLVFTTTAVARNGSDGWSILPTFTAPISAIIISRFLLELQESNQIVVRLDRDDPLHSSRSPYDSTPSFISSLGGFVNPELGARSSDEGSLELQVRSREEAMEEDGVFQPELPQASSSG